MTWDTALAFLSRHKQSLAIAGVVLAAALYAAGVRRNPPGFHLDESSVSYNAYSISQTGRDEHGNPWPLFFRAFGDYKNPVYVYLLAGLYKLTGPSILVARLFSAAGGLLAAFLLGLLAARITGRRAVGLLVAVSSLFTPWLYETSRLVMEVAIYPLVLALFLLCLHRVSAKARWSYVEVAGLALTLALITYTYSTGRLLAPLLALGLALFITRERWPSVLKTWGAYAVTVIPLLIFNWRHPGALTARFKATTYLRSEATYGETILEVVRHYIAHLNPWRLLVAGEPNPVIFVNGHFLLATFIVALIGGYLVLKNGRREAWWRFILYGLLVSIIPAALTNEYFHLLRLSALPVFLLVLSAPGFARLLEMAQRRRAWRAAFMLVLAVTALQAAFFVWQFHKSASTPLRRHQFDADYPQRILAPAIASSSTPIYLADSPVVPGYIHAYWYAALLGINRSRFFLLQPAESPPTGATVITTEAGCPRCQVLATSEPYTLYTVNAPPLPLEPMPDEGFRAELYSPALPMQLRVREQVTIPVRVKNVSEVIWLARERSAGQYHVSLGNHWLNLRGEMVTGDDGRSALRQDLQPGEEIELSLTINAPRRAGEYILEIDMLQEGVTWFAMKGSATLKLPVRVE
ncbi:MAG TPA: glycosyltransferase family 39 protein [Pyrinomonadaceae bacterium]|nr:glycosyltransferase family 39 protein [Pyrinomonadaceae bacterium]